MSAFHQEKLVLKNAAAVIARTLMIITSKWKMFVWLGKIDASMLLRKEFVTARNPSVRKNIVNATMQEFLVIHNVNAMAAATGKIAAKILYDFIRFFILYLLITIIN